MVWEADAQGEKCHDIVCDQDRKMGMQAEPCMHDVSSLVTLLTLPRQAGMQGSQRTHPLLSCL